jgi:hypothetical protein
MPTTPPRRSHRRSSWSPKPREARLSSGKRSIAAASPRCYQRVHPTSEPKKKKKKKKKMEDTGVDERLLETMASAIELTERALTQVAHIAIEQIHEGLETSNHIEAAERDMRSALRQLVLADRELRRSAAGRRVVLPRSPAAATAEPVKDAESAPPQAIDAHEGHRSGAVAQRFTSDMSG